jgi:hypothetical protein
LSVSLPFLGTSAWGVDLTGGSVRAVQLERRGGRYRVIDVIDQPVSPAGEGAEPLSAHLPDTVGRALVDLLQARRASLADPIFVSMPAFGSKHGLLEVPGGDPSKVSALLDYELHHALKGEPEPWLVRMGTPAPAAGGVVVEYHAHRRELVQTFVADVRRFGLPLDGLVPGPLALARFAALEWPTRGRRLVLEVNRTRTDYLYLSDREPRWRSFPFGCGTLREPGSPESQPGREIERLAAQLAREHLATHRALFGAHDGSVVDRVILLGDAARHDALRRALQERIGAEVVVPQAFDRFDVGRRAAADRHALHHGTAVGLALVALSGDAAASSLVPPPARRRALRTLPKLAAAMLLLSLGLFTTGRIVRNDLDALERQRAELLQGVRWESASEWEESRGQAAAAAGQSAEIVARAALLRREVELPERLLAAMEAPSAAFRLVSLAIEPAADGAEAEIVVEVERGLATAVERIRGLLEKELGLAVSRFETHDGERGIMTVSLRAALAPAEGRP